MSHDEEEFPRGSCGHSTAEAPSSDSSDLNMIVDMNEGFILPSSRHPSVDLKKLVQSFEKSSEGETLNKRIDVIQNSSVEKTYVVKLDPKRDAAKTWCRAVRALYWVSCLSMTSNSLIAEIIQKFNSQPYSVLCNVTCPSSTRNYFRYRYLSRLILVFRWNILATLLRCERSSSLQIGHQGSC